MSNLYLSRYASETKLEAPDPVEDLSMVVVIPCHCEPEILSTLNSLNQCEQPKGAFEVIVVVNESETADDPIRERNLISVNQITKFQATHDLPLHLVHVQLPSKHAGVGLARKIGMDDAVRRFDGLAKDGIIVALDADCQVKPNYLQAIEDHFLAHPVTPGCSIYYEHPLHGSLDNHLYHGIAGYELHLRYYTHALRYAGHPFAFQTVGSSMAVRSSAYQKQGGMNRRQAGEDFYFLQNIFLLGNFTELNTTTVYPSARISERVPFGTGRAQLQWQNNESTQFYSYHHQTFEDLKQGLAAKKAMWELKDEHSWEMIPTSMKSYIGRHQYGHKLETIKSQSHNFEGFNKRFFYWCNGVFAFKFAHHARDHHYPNQPIEEGAAWLLENHYQIKSEKSVHDLLLQYRKLDLEL